ncbi:MAG: FtsH protease activity modulator HflK [Candidatus Dasytiphilus stammeri]
MGYQSNNDPWGNHPSRNKGNRILKYPDFFQKFNTINKKLCRLTFGRNKSNKPNNSRSPINILCLLVIITIIIWLISGLYTIQELDRGVVTRFGKFSHLVNPGLNWKLNFIDTVQTVNVSTVRDVATEGIMLTSDENVVHVEMNVQYRVSNPRLYLFYVNNPDDSLSQATDSVLRGVIGKYSMDEILTEGRTIIRSETQRDLENTLNPYHMGITLVDVNFQAARPPEEVKAAFDDAIAALENEQQYIREAEAYANEVQPQANGKAQRILADALAYKTRIILEAQGEVTGFNKILPEYKLVPKIARERLYIETMEHIFSNTHNILINDKENHFLVLPYFFNQSNQNNDNNQKLSQSLISPKSGKVTESTSSPQIEKGTESTSSPQPDSDLIFSQRKLEALRNSPKDIGYTGYKRANNA